jgi:hypothetical protein
MEDIFNADASGAAPASHVIAAPASIAWGDPPPSLPPGSRMAVLAGDPSKPGPFVIRAQVPAGYKVPPHWHPTDENLTILSGTVALGMGETWDESKMQNVPTGGLDRQTPARIFPDAQNESMSPTTNGHSAGIVASMGAMRRST